MVATRYSNEISAQICERLANGESLLAICKDMNLSYSAARRWEQDIPEHAADSARAREIGCHALAEECIEIADTPEEGVETVEKPDGLVETRRGDMIQHRRLKIDTRMRLIGKWLAKVYGDKQQIEHSGTLSVAETLRQAREKRRGEG